jgi:hypothetical protein
MPKRKTPEQEPKKVGRIKETVQKGVDQTGKVIGDAIKTATFQSTSSSKPRGKKT